MISTSIPGRTSCPTKVVRAGKGSEKKALYTSFIGLKLAASVKITVTLTTSFRLRSLAERVKAFQYDSLTMFVAGVLGKQLGYLLMIVRILR